MKTRLLSIALAAATIAACHRNDGTRESIPGTYVNHAEGEYSIADDTLEVTPDSTQEHTYRILRRSTFVRINEGDKGNPVRQREEWTVLYHPETQILQDIRKRRNIPLQPESGSLTVERRKYIKVDD